MLVLLRYFDFLVLYPGFRKKRTCNGNGLVNTAAYLEYVI